MITGKRGSVELVLFVAVALVAVGGLVFIAMNGGIMGMMVHYDARAAATAVEGTLDTEPYGITQPDIGDQHIAYLSCRQNCLSGWDTRFAPARYDAQDCLQECAELFGQQPWGAY